MNIAILGYGKMGKAIEEIARSRNHTITATIDKDNQEDFESEEFKISDVAIEFSSPKSAFANYQKCFEKGVPVVSGTTGWLDKIDEIKKQCAENGQTFFYASNFSLGVNVFFEINRKLAEIMNGFEEYAISAEETHHIHKLDAPSGTAITLLEDIIANVDRYKNWNLANEKGSKDSISIKDFREGEVPGIHTIRYESDIDFIEITHSAKTRKGFALGAVIAAEFTKGKKGFLTMKDLLKF